MTREDMDALSPPERQARLDALLRDGVLAEDMDSSALEQRVRECIARGRRSFSARRMALAASVAATLFAAILGYRVLLPPRATQLCADAAQDHRDEVTGRQHRRWLRDPKAIEELAERNGIPAPVVVTLAPAGYRLEFGKLCRLDGRVFLHLVYTRNGREFSAYLRRSDAQPANRPIDIADTGHEHIAYFEAHQMTALFVTDQSSEAALSLARSAAKAL